MNQIHTYKPKTLTTTDLDALEIDLTELSTRRRFITAAGGLIGAAALGACGVGEEAAAPTTTTGATRTVTDLQGRTVRIPTSPECVVALHDLELAFEMERLGVIPVGFSRHQRSLEDRFTDYGGVPEVLLDLPDTGIINEPNLEAIAALQPDLIISTAVNLERAAEFEQIAPTIFTTFTPDSVFSNARFIADMLGVPDRIEDRIADYEAAIAATREAYPGGLDDLEYALFVTYGEDQVTLLCGETQPGNYVIAALGGRKSPRFEQLCSNEPFPSVSLETLPEIDADVIFHTSPDATEGQPSPLLPLLQATFAGRNEQIPYFKGDAMGFSVTEGLFASLEQIKAMVLEPGFNLSGTFE